MRHLPYLATLLVIAGCEQAAGPSPDAGTRPPPRTDERGPSAESLVEVPIEARFSPSGAYRLDPNLPLPYRRFPQARPLKADQFDSIRAADPEEYALTHPPARLESLRPMVEWEPMKALMLAVPGYAFQYSATTKTFIDITMASVDHGEVWVIIDSFQAENLYKQKLAQRGLSQSRMQSKVRFIRQPLDSYWFIDFGPLPLIDTASQTWAVADFRYYHERPLDDGIPTLFSRAATRFGELATPTTYRMPLSTEGGTFQATTDGVCFTSSRQLYNMSCEAGSCRESILGLSLTALQTHQYAVEMENVLKRYVGCKDLLILHSISDDGTGHIDMFMKVIDDGRIIIGDYRRPYDNDAQEENDDLMDENTDFLEAYNRPNGDTFEVIRMPMPGHRLIEDNWGQYEVPFTYLNSTFFNGVNLWPAYAFPEWEASRSDALDIWNEVLPDMEHVWIDAEELSYQSGAIHCVTRTVPAMPAGAWVPDGACSDGVCVSEDGGYDGLCRLSNVSTDLCWGPEWLCGCNDCRNCPEAVENVGCNGVSWRGCCDGGDVLYCENFELKKLPCGGTGCGWDSVQGYYNCGLEGVDPTGETEQICVCEPQCDGRSCGPDGCGGVCGTCAESDRCIEGNCRNDCVDCAPGTAFCDGEVSNLCVEGIEGCNGLERVDCAANGLRCEVGDCVEVWVPEPGPETVEPVGTEDDTEGGAEVDEGDTRIDHAETAAETVEPKARREDDSCAGGMGLSLQGLLGLWLLRRRLSRP